MIKKFINIGDIILCLQYDKQGKVTIGGDYKQRELIWRIYMVCFEECDGEPHFYEVTRNKTRVQFRCSMKRWQQALGYITDEEYELEDTEHFNRLM